MIEHSPSIEELSKALHQAQASLNGVVKDAKNPHFKSRYATLENVIDAAKTPLQSAGLAFTQAPGAIVDGSVEITTMLMHSSGQWLRSTLHVPLSKRDAQAVGSAITYGCRYALMATLGLPPVDDDAESAMERSPAPAKGSITVNPPPRNAAAAAAASAPERPETVQVYIRAAIKIIAQEADGQALSEWWTAEKKNRLDLGLTDEEIADLRDLVKARMDTLKQQKEAA